MYTLEWRTYAAILHRFFRQGDLVKGAGKVCGDDVFPTRDLSQGGVDVGH